MTMQEYKERLKGLYAKHENEKRELIKQCATENNQYKEGDIIEDHIGRGEIVSIGFYMSSENPQCIYQCKPLNKNGGYSKKENFRTIYGMNILKKETA